MVAEIAERNAPARMASGLATAAHPCPPRVLIRPGLPATARGPARGLSSGSARMADPVIQVACLLGRERNRRQHTPRAYALALIGCTTKRDAIHARARDHFHCAGEFVQRNGRPCSWMVRVTSPMTLTVDPTSTAPALTLRPWQDSDIPTIVAAHCDEAMRRWLMRPIGDEDAARAWLTYLDTHWADGTLLSWAVEEAGTVVGHFVIKAANPPVMLATGVGYWTVTEARGRGIASRCVEAATEWLFGGQDFMPADEIELLHTVGNEGSCRVAQKCGYVLDSVLPPMPPKFPHEGHRHLRKRPRSAG